MNKADIILSSNAIFTGLSEETEKGSIAIKENKILAVGTKEEIEKLIGEKTKVFDFKNKLIMPGFVDAHVHYFLGSVAASEHMCTEITFSESEEDCIRIIKEFAQNHPEEERIIGIGWFPANWKDAPLPTKESLDAAIPDKPVYLIAADVHTFWMNTKALEEAGITGDEVIEGGEIGKYEDGSLNGLLFEPEAFIPAMHKVLDLPKEKMKKAQKDFFAYINSCGVTSVSEMSADRINEETLKTYKVVKEIEAQGEMSIRLHVYPELGKTPEYDHVKKAKAELDSEKFKISGLKGFIDGVTSTHTGYLLEPYEDKKETRGEPIQHIEVYKECTIKANKEGFGVRFHAIGDGAVRMALDVFEASNLANNNIGNIKGLRNTIEHCETIDKDDIPRFKELGVIASMQPYHRTQDSDEKIIRMGKERCKGEWPHKSIIDAGARLAFGTDYPVVDFNPFPTLYAAITRCDDEGRPLGVNEEEKITLAQALKAYTSESAYLYGRENEIGTLEKGKLADVVVLGQNIFELSAAEILNCNVEMTIMDGKIVYKKEDGIDDK